MYYHAFNSIVSVNWLFNNSDRQIFTLNWFMIFYFCSDVTVVVIFAEQYKLPVLTYKYIGIISKYNQFI